MIWIDGWKLQCLIVVVYSKLRYTSKQFIHGSTLKPNNVWFLAGAFIPTYIKEANLTHEARFSHIQNYKLPKQMNVANGIENLFHHCRLNVTFIHKLVIMAWQYRHLCLLHRRHCLRKRRPLPPRLSTAEEEKRRRWEREEGPCTRRLVTGEAEGLRLPPHDRRRGPAIY